MTEKRPSRTYLILRRNHPDWPHEKIDEEVQKIRLRRKKDKEIDDLIFAQEFDHPEVIRKARQN